MPTLVSIVPCVCVRMCLCVGLSVSACAFVTVTVFLYHSCCVLADADQTPPGSLSLYPNNLALYDTPATTEADNNDFVSQGV